MTYRSLAARFVDLPLFSFCVLMVLPPAGLLPAAADTPAVDSRGGDAMIAEYFRQETARLAERCLAEIETLEDWQNNRETYRRQLFEMLGLDPLPERTELKAVTTGRLERDEIIVENLHFQSRPGLYVTANLYLPKALDGPAPAILYVCGHGGVKKDGISYGNKTHYQHHAAWFARHGYVCLVLDTLQLGEIEGIHHGTYRHDMWWWNARGYTPAGVEAWNCIRALDYLQSRPEVNAEKIGVSGRSGGGAYSWWISALDDRIKVAVPVAGITDLENHVIDGTVEGHCDCMFMVNTYRWNYAQVAALMAPRPLLISNSDKDGIFPLEGVFRIHHLVRKIYRLHDADDRLGLQITEGPHKDTQELRVHAFHWFNRFLKGEDPLIERTAGKLFEPEELKVFDQLPEDEINTQIHESFTAVAQEPAVPESGEAWRRQRDEWRDALAKKSFRGWPQESEPLNVEQAFSSEHDGLSLAAYDFTSQGAVRLRLYVLGRSRPEGSELVVLNVLDEAGWNRWWAAMQAGFGIEKVSPVAVGTSTDAAPGKTTMETDTEEFNELAAMLKSQPWIMAYVAPRGIGPTAWNRDRKKQIQIRRRFMLLGQTLDGMRVWDTRRAVQALRTLGPLRTLPLWLQGEGQAAGIALYASLFEPGIARLDLWQLPASHREGPIFLNVQRYLDVPQAVTMAAERSKIRLYQPSGGGWEYPMAVAQKLGWGTEQIAVRSVPADTSAGGK